MIIFGNYIIYSICDIKESEASIANRNTKFVDTAVLNKEVNNNNITQNSFIPNPVLLFLSQRPEPKPMSIKSSKNNKTLPSSMRRRIDQAGGYDFDNYNKRNWSEIMSQL